MAKKEDNKFTIQFNPADPQHAQTIAILNQQGRRKAQFITNAVMHYLNCSNTPEIPQAAPIDAAVIESIVRRIMEEQSQTLAPSEKANVKEIPQRTKPKTESIRFDEAAELLSEDGIATIANTIGRFRMIAQ